ncbi:hypothetical protein RvY_03562-2 [Ramazzottius varieornatus]|uniref:Uncharacterized protein n=1 Tax=Ramazzottius varieornatus TaxID=947166 RepID=A0A1D1UU69_RAMVA|nr:hypothetical protein RvY_03562-2 [Ramazzottius varieornatus]
MLVDFKDQLQAKRTMKELKQLKDQPPTPNKIRDRSSDEKDVSPIVERKKRKKKRKVRVADSDDEGKVFYSKLIQDGTPQKKARLMEESGESDSENVQKPKDVSPPVSVSSRETSPVETPPPLPVLLDFVPNKVLFAELFGDSSSSENDVAELPPSINEVPPKAPLAASKSPAAPATVSPPLSIPVVPQRPAAAPVTARAPVQSVAPVTPPEDPKLQAAIQRDRLRVEPTTKLIALNEARPPPRIKSYIAPASSRLRPVPIEPLLPPPTLRRNNITGLPGSKRCIKSVTAPPRSPNLNGVQVPPEQPLSKAIPPLSRAVPLPNNLTVRIANKPTPLAVTISTVHIPPHQLDRTPLAATPTPSTSAAFFPRPPNSPHRQSSGFKLSSALNHQRVQESWGEAGRPRLEEPRKDRVVSRIDPPKVAQSRAGKSSLADKTAVKPVRLTPAAMKADTNVGEKAAQQTQADPRPKPSTDTVVAPSECQRPFPPTNAVRKSSLVTSDSRSAVPPVTVTSSVAVTPPKASSTDAPVDPRSKLSSSDAPVDPRTKPSCLTVNSTVQPQPSLRPNAPPAFSLPLPPPPAPPLNIHTNSPLLLQVNAQSAVRPALPYPPASAHLQQRLVNQALTNYHQAYRPHPPPLVNQPPFTQSSFPFNQFHQPAPAFGSPHVLHSPYFFSSDPNPFSLYGQGPPPQQQPFVKPLYVMNQPVNHFGMVAPHLSLDNHNSLLGESSQHSFGLVVPQPLLHGTPVAPPTHHDNLHVLTSGNTHGTVPARPVHPVPVSPPRRKKPQMIQIWTFRRH